MTQEAFKAWWYNEGSQAPYTHHDCEEHTMRMCEIAWANGAYKALAEHAMQEVQRLGQEIEQKPVAHCKVRPLRGDESFPKVEIDWVNQPVPGPLFTAPPQRKPLTDEEILNIHALRCWPRTMFADKSYGIALDTVTVKDFARAIEAAHGIKENT